MFGSVTRDCLNTQVCEGRAITRACFSDTNTTNCQSEGSLGGGEVLPLLLPKLAVGDILDLVGVPKNI